ncbi:MAG: DUF5320 domain-containing protein [Sedimentisphaerales bacterium]|nr:DUF5320 domain-containing protein [Sedimentisphaerales bacterium]
MPGGDGTGPVGMGPMTGRAAGFCAGFPAPGYMNPVGGRGYFGRGRGFGGRGGGRGWRHWFYATGLPGWARADYGYPAGPWAGQPITAEQEIDSLKKQAEYFKDTLEDITKQIKELESQQAGKK